METDGDGDPVEKGHSKMSHLPNWLAQTFSRPQCAIKVCVHSSKLILRCGMMSYANAITLFPIPHRPSPSATHSSTGCVWSGWGGHWKPGQEAGHCGGQLTRKVPLARPNWLHGVSRRLFNILRPFHSVRCCLLTLYGFIAHLEQL